MLARFKLDNTLLTCDQGNFNQITARGRNRTLVTVVRDTCTSTPYNRHIENFIQSHTWTQLGGKNPSYQIRFKLMLNLTDYMRLENDPKNHVTTCFSDMSELLEIENIH